MTPRTGTGFPGPLGRIRDGVRLRVVRWLSGELTLATPDGGTLRVRAATIASYNRVMMAWGKEPGTTRWLAELRPGETLFDVGANIGVYSLLAARTVGAGGRVVSFEPHTPTAAELLHNIATNGLADRVTVVTAPLSDRAGYADFNYSSLEAATALSGYHVSDGEMREKKLLTSIDRLLADGALPVPDAIKIDVDGAEVQVVEGMTGLLAGPHRPRTIQIELDPECRERCLAILQDSGYVQVAEHRSAVADAEVHVVNAVFQPC